MRKRTKKGLFIIALLALCLLTFCACGDNTTAQTTVAEVKTTAVATTVAEVKTTAVAITASEVKTTAVATTASEVNTTAVVNTAPEKAATRKIVDMRGDEVEIPAEIKTVVNAWPASNSVMLLVGGGDLLIGTMAPTAKNEWSQLVYPNIVNLPTNVRNVEDVLKMNPDLFIANGDSLISQMRAAGIPAVNLDFSDYDDMKQSFGILGEILGGEYQVKLEKWGKYIDDWAFTISERVKDIKEEDRYVLYHNSAQLDEELTSTCASPSIAKSWTDICGCIYLGDLTNDPAATSLSEEEILKHNPDIIIIGGINQAITWDKLHKSELWADVPAMKNGKAFLAPMGMFSWCRQGMESAMMLPWLASTVYPELFPEINIRQIVFEFYKDFAGVELTDAQIENMLIGYGPNDPYGATVVGK